MSFKLWSIPRHNKKVKEIADKLAIPEIVAQVLFSRGFSDLDEIKKFIGLQKETYLAPMDWVGMKKFVDMLKSAIDSCKKICIYGDYDADGVTSSALVYTYLKSCGADVIYYIPERDKDGYGLNNKAIDFLKSENVDVILTVDNGISAYNEVEYANSLGIKVLISDHHKLPSKLPNADAIINPHLNGDSSKINFAGVGVAFELIRAMESDNPGFDFEQYLDLVAVGTIGDSIELFGETRDIVKAGLKKISDSPRSGIKEILKRSKIKTSEIDSMSIAFGIVPRINASGRMGDAASAMKLLISESDVRAKVISQSMESLNILRKSIEKEIVDEIETFLIKDKIAKYQKVIVAVGENWYHGVLGIAAAKISEKYGKPCILITIEGDNARGSCRSTEGFSIYELLNYCKGSLEKFGGHNMAAGFNMKTEKIEEFKLSVIDFCSKHDVPPLTLKIDACLKPSEISFDIFESLDCLKPFGSGNPEPTFGIINMEITEVKSIGNGNHTKIFLKKSGKKIEALWFGKKSCDFLYSPGEKVDIAVNLIPNEYMGQKSVTLKILDVRRTGYDFKNAIMQRNIYENFKLYPESIGSDLKFIDVNREDVAKIYRFLRKNQNIGIRPDVISEKVFLNDDYIARIYIIIDVLDELNLIDVIRRGSNEYSITLNQVSSKVDLKNSKILKSILLMKEG